MVAVTGTGAVVGPLAGAPPPSAAVVGVSLPSPSAVGSPIGAVDDGSDAGINSTVTSSRTSLPWYVAVSRNRSVTGEAPMVGATNRAVVDVGSWPAGTPSHVTFGSAVGQSFVVPGPVQSWLQESRDPRRQVDVALEQHDGRTLDAVGSPDRRDDRQVRAGGDGRCALDVDRVGGAVGAAPRVLLVRRGRPRPDGDLLGGGRRGQVHEHCRCRPAGFDGRSGGARDGPACALDGAVDAGPPRPGDRGDVHVGRDVQQQHATQGGPRPVVGGHDLDAARTAARPTPTRDGCPAPGRVPTD